jgi:osmoprotectant transport system substrate-binding protein
MAYGTDGALAALGLKVLQDDRGVQPVYAPAPIVRAEVLEKYPDIPKILEPVFKSLDRETLQSLNAQIAIEGKDPKQVAKQYLSEKGWL